jgi:hypothetical protein
LLAESGLFRYDGSKVEPVLGIHAGINVIEDTKAGILVGTNDGLFRYDGSKVADSPGSAR